MITYIPFLKFKTGEVNAIGALDADVRAAICPFFDLPKKEGLTADEFKGMVAKADRALGKHMPDLAEFYFDTHDISDALFIDGIQNYRYLLEYLSEWPVIPVVGLDRDPSRIDAVKELKGEGKIASAHLALRLSFEDFESYGAVEDEIAALAPIFELFEDLDLVFDCRICDGADPGKASKAIVKFSKQFCAEYQVRRVVVTGSSIPSSISTLLKVRTDLVIDRMELAIFQRVSPDHDHTALVFGDYATVSPDYADVSLPPEMLQTMMTPRFIYTMKGRHFIIRGGRIKGDYGQYFGMAKTLCGKSFFRGKGFSPGDTYLEEKGRGLGSYCTPAAVIKPTVNAHITYMVSVLPF